MRILLVEDHEKLAQSLRKGLQAQGFQVDWESDGEQAFERVARARQRDDQFDAVILDGMLPHMDGFEICRRWRKRSIGVPILMLTARDTIPDRVKGLDAGADDYLVKPFSLEEVAARLRALVRRPPLDPEKTQRHGGVEIDPTGLRALVHGRDAHLTVKEFRLLELLIRYPGRILTREQIINNLWGDDFEGASNVVDVHVKNLRQKLERSGPEGEHHALVIETVRGVGYRVSV